MKKLVGLSIVAISLFATSGIDFGIGGGKNRVSNSPMETYHFYNVRIGKHLPKNHVLRFELERSTNIKIPGIDPETSMDRILVNVEKDFPIKNGKFIPYVFVGAGYQWIKGPYDNNAVADIGAGAKFFMTKTFGFFAETRALRDFHDNDNHFGFLGGIVINFGNNQNEIQPQIQQPVKPIKEVKPAPKPKPVVIDSDHDGVPDNLDKCPNTPLGVKVDKYGCPIDSDGDGVADYLDKCPNTPKGVHVDKYGCPVSFNLDITFDCCSAKIKPKYMKEIEKFAEFLKENPAYKVELEGYTDNTGSKTYNIILSQKRAKAVYEALIKLGISKDRLKWVGFGPANPIAPNDTPEGRAKNRRVIAKLYF